MKGLFRWLGACALLACMVSGMVWSAGNTDLQDLCTGKNQSNCPYKIDASGNVTAAGSVTSVGLTSTGSNTFTGAITQSGGQVVLSTTTFSGATGLWPVTSAQVGGLTATTTGQLVFCTNCNAFNAGFGEVCVSTGSTAVAQFIAISSATAITACR